MSTNSANETGATQRGKRVVMERWPRGLWVGRKLRSPEQRRKHGVSPRQPGESREGWMRRTDRLAAEAGNPLLRAFSASFHWLYRREVDGRKLPMECGSFEEHVTSEAQARALAKAEVEAIRLRREAELLGVRADLRGQVAAVKEGRWCSVGEYLAAVVVVLQQRNRQQFRRALSNLRMVIAVGTGLSKPDGQRLTREVRDKVDAMSMEVVCAATAEAYMLACQVAAGAALEDDEGRPVLNWTSRNPPVVNRTINSNLGNACVCVGKSQRVGPVEKLAVPWAVIEKFGKRRLPVPAKDVGEEVPTLDCYEAMMRGHAELLRGDEGQRELALVNELLRKLGLRSGELTMARLSWLVEMGGRWYVEVKDRPLEGYACKGAKAGLLPLGDELVGRLRARCAEAAGAGLENPFLILPMLPSGVWDATRQRYAELRARKMCVRDGHNAWLKQYLPEARTQQGNHRLRKLCATRLYRAVRAKLEAGGESQERAHDAAATEVRNFIRHESEATTLLHYIAPEMMRVSKHVTAAMIDEVLG